MKFNLKLNKLSLIVFFVLILGFIIYLLLNFNPNSNSQLNRNSSTFNLGPLPSPSPIEVPKFTGAQAEIIILPTSTFQYQFDQLANLTPFSTEEFTITVDFSINKFIVTLSPPEDANKLKFFQWLKNNQFTLITPDTFVFYP